MRERISPTNEMVLNAAAWSAYGINFVIEIIAGWLFGVGLIASIIFMIIAYTCFAAYFISKEVKLFSPKFIGNFLFGAFISAIPVINLFYFSTDRKTGVITPGIRKNIGRIIEIVQKEDAQYNNSQIAQKAQLSKQERDVRIQKIMERQQQSDLYDRAA